MEPRRLPVRQTENLHKGRVSTAGASYFVTMVTQHRKPWLVSPSGRAAILTTLQLWHAENRGRVLAATVMPDHVHVLFELGDKLTVGQTIARWKAEARKRIEYAGQFQRDFWEHMLRQPEVIEDYALYIFLNPYRAGLLPTESLWSGWWTPVPELFRFIPALNSTGAPPAEWTEWPDERFAALAHGE